MLYNDVNHFNWQVNNFGDSFITDTGTGTVLTADAVAHTKGTDTALLAGIAHDCWGISLNFTSGFTDTVIRRQMIDLLIDPAAGVGNAGSSWSVLINNLYTNSPGTGAGQGGHGFFFPIFLPAGTAIGARTQDVVGGATVRCFIRVIGQPTRPDLAKVGYKVQTIGATTATTTGVAITPGTTAVGSYTASMGTLTNNAWWWQIGIGSADTSITANHYRFDIAFDATAKYIAARSIPYGSSVTTEVTWKYPMGEGLPIAHAPAGTDVYARAAAQGTPDGSMTTVVYAVT